MNRDFTEGKCEVPVSVYCGRMQNNEAPLNLIRSNSVDSNLHLQRGGWLSKGKAILQSSLNLPLKKTRFVKSTEGGQQSVGGWLLDSNNFYHLLDGNRSQAASRVHGYSVKVDWAEAEADGSHPSLDTLQLKNKLKRRMSEILPQKSSFETVHPLKPPLSRPASQRVLNATEPIPPIEVKTNSEANEAYDNDLPSKDKNEEGPVGKFPGCSPMEAGEGHAVSVIVPEEIKISLQQLRSSAEKKRKLLGASLSQSSLKLPSSDEINFQPLSFRSLQLDNRTQSLHAIVTPLKRESVTQGLCSDSEDQETQLPADCSTQLKEAKQSRNRVKSAPITGGMAMREGTCIPQSTTHQDTEHCIDQSTPFSAKKDKSEGPSLNQTMVISFRLSAESGPEVSKQESVEDAETENEERLCHMTISKSVQEKMHQKRREEMEQRQQRKESEQKQQLREQLQDITLHRDTVPVLRLLNSREFSKTSLSSTLNNGSSLRKRINRPSLPSIPNIIQTNNVSRHFSAQSLPGFPLDSPEGDAEMDDEEFLEVHSFTRQEQGLTEALKLLANSDWEMKRKGLSSVRCLARFNQELLLTKLHAVCLAVTKEVNNLRSKVSRSAILSLGELFSQLRRNMDQEVDEVTRILLHKTGDSNEFIREEAAKALAVMAENVSPSRALTALIAGGLNHRNTIVRKCTAENLLSIVERLGAERLLSGSKDNMDQIVQAMVKFSQDGNQDTRFYGRKALNVLMSHPEFERHMDRSLLSQDLHRIITAIKQRGAAFSEPYSPKGRSSRINSSLKHQESIPNTGRAELDTPRQQGLSPRRSIIRGTEAVEQVKQMNKLLSSKEFQERIQGISLLLQHCETNPGFVTSNIVNIFDVFIPRLQDSNKKVNQFALQSMSTMIPVLKDDLHRVLHSIVIVVTDNLNSKNTGIYTAAVHVLDTLIDHIDNLLLLQPFTSRVQFISGRAMQDIIERLSVLVQPVYCRKPQTVERYVLPVLWYLLGNMTGNGVIKGGSRNVRGVTAKLATNLHQHMGTSLQEYAASQPTHVIKALRELSEKEL